MSHADVHVTQAAICTRVAHRLPNNWILHAMFRTVLQQQLPQLCGWRRIWPTGTYLCPSLLFHLLSGVLLLMHWKKSKQNKTQLHRRKSKQKGFDDRLQKNPDWLLCCLCLYSQPITGGFITSLQLLFIDLWTCWLYTSGWRVCNAIRLLAAAWHAGASWKVGICISQVGRWDCDVKAGKSCKKRER